MCALIFGFAGFAFASCTQDVEGGDEAGFAIKSYFPVKVIAGQSVQIMGRGLDAVTGVVFPGAGRVEVFEKVGSGLINITAPAGVTAGELSVVAGDGSVAVAAVPLTIGQPKVVSVSPGDEAGVGQVIELTGTDMEFFNRAVFPGKTGDITVVAMEFVRISTALLRFKVPYGIKVGDAQVIKLYAMDGSSVDLPALKLTEEKGPEVEPSNTVTGVWKWAEGTPYSAGGYGSTTTTGWSPVANADLGAEANFTMIFGATDYQKLSDTGEIVQTSPYTIDMTKQREGTVDWVPVYSIGELNIPDGDILKGVPRWDAWGTEPIHTYLIGVSTTKDDLWLMHGAESAWGTGDGATIWNFTRVPARTIAAGGDVFLYQRQDVILEGVDKTWWIDPDFFGVTLAEGGKTISSTNFVFKAISGNYRIVRDDALKYISVEVLNAAGTGLATTAADGTGAVWVIGDGLVGKPSYTAKGVGWDPSKGFSLAPIAPKIHRVTLTAGRHIATDAINFKFFHQKAWGGEFTNTNYASWPTDLIKMGLGQGVNGADPGNLNLAQGVKLKSGTAYEFTLDLTGGVDNAKLTVVAK
jgi:hypothetical protein